MIYRLDDKIAIALETAYDPDTGELLDGITDDYLCQLVRDIKADFDTKIDAIASDVKNLDAEAEAIAAEIANLTERKRRVINRRERDKRLLAYLLDGQKWKNERHNISFRRSEEVVVDEDFVEWASTYAPGLLNIKPPEPRKQEIKNAIKTGTYFEHAHLEEHNNIVIQKLKKKEEKDK